MQLVSLRDLKRGFLGTLRRFPLPILCSVLSTSILLYLTTFLKGSLPKPYEGLIKASLIVGLGLPLFLSLRVFFEVNGAYRQQRRLWEGLSAGLLLLYYFYLPFDLKTAEVMRYAVIALALHFLVAIAPFALQRKMVNAFWQYNYHLFLRFSESLVYSVTLFVGVALALLLFSQLFDVKIAPEVYLRYWIFIAGIFNTIYFLAGIPSNLTSLEKDASYPAGLKVFTQYLLVPLVTLYLAILIAYAAKILVEWNLPKGLVGYMVSSAAVFGMLTLLLIHPVKDQAGNRWMNVYAKYFYLALFPLIILLTVSIYRRIADYGITENRYILLVLAPWLLAMSIYFTFSSTKTIKVIPTSIFCVLVFSAIGPWSATAVSRHSQTIRLLDLLVKNSLLQGGELKKSTSPLAFEDRKELSSLLDYLHKTHGLDTLKSDISDPTLQTLALTPHVLLERIGVTYTGSWEQADIINLYRPLDAAFPVKGFDYLLLVNFYAQQSPETVILKTETPHGEILVVQKKGDSRIAVRHRGAELPFDLLQALDTPEGQKVIIRAENGALRGELHVESVNGRRSGDAVTLQSATGKLLLTFKAH